MSTAIEEIDAAAGADICHEGEPGDAMFVVLRGAVQVYTRNHDGRELVLARLETGEYFGEQALLPGGTGRRNASNPQSVSLPESVSHQRWRPLPLPRRESGRRRSLFIIREDSGGVWRAARSSREPPESLRSK